MIVERRGSESNSDGVEITLFGVPKSSNFYAFWLFARKHGQKLSSHLFPLWLALLWHLREVVV